MKINNECLPKLRSWTLGLLNIFIDGIGSGTEFTLSRFADHTMLSGAVNLLKGRDAIQRELEKLKGVGPSVGF